MKMMLHYFVKQKDAMLLSFTFFLNQYGLAKLCNISFFFLCLFYYHFLSERMHIIIINEQSLYTLIDSEIL